MGLGLFICRGCQKSGDLITFVREVEHIDPGRREAVVGGNKLQADHLVVAVDEQQGDGGGHQQPPEHPRKEVLFETEDREKRVPGDPGPARATVRRPQ